MLPRASVLASQPPVMLLAVAVVGGMVAAVSVRGPAASFHGPPPSLLGVGMAGLAGTWCRSAKVGG